MNRLRAEDRGSVSVITIGILVIVLGVVLTVAASTQIQLQRARLTHAADEAALAAADALDLGAYYAEGDARLSPGRLEEEARAQLAASSARQGLDGVSLVRASSPDGVTVEVVVSLRAPLLFGVAWLPGRVDLSATARARSTTI
ncbi:pilus assembly protein TadG-related protein [Demequina sp. SYSU T00039]|uniref:Pilus assembly protein TadG-related protein n=1 Tax=Demequina lignilytica TaxID=3051663 RepID=A0AAW7M5A6_9MICO|nr:MULTISPECIES: pilus assembly protein TadG-related protein [unclassified Demequina]MDN4478925.1 pilus assembly protein TadG-related protein [Demequina sp. SYSU T00039-1]MDN4488800.1 pilus assembly protein TadG-related protein [Demequina sp. SYSU T00039]MDN4491487.1 pilus assembly protein TadG-related protein [Demequina sp. SYSU T00068]